MTTKHIPNVSIGMSVYNGEKFIPEALYSVQRQTFTEFDFIVFDDVSTDGTEAICREYATRDEWIHYVRQPENRGAIANFQFVLDKSVGEYFMWAAADDVSQRSKMTHNHPLTLQNILLNKCYYTKHRR